YIEAQPQLNLDQDISVKIRQRSLKIKDVWFPYELNTTMFFPQTMGGTIAAGRTIIDSVIFNPAFDNIRFDHLSKVLPDTNAISAIEPYRDSLTEKEKNTYTYMDSLGATE